MRLPGVLLAALALHSPPEGCRGENAGVAPLGDGPPPAADAEKEDGEQEVVAAKRKRVKISGLDVIDLNLHSFFGLGNNEDVEGNNDGRRNIENSLFDAIQADPSCQSSEAGDDDDCFSPPASTIEEVVEESDVQSYCGLLIDPDPDDQASLSEEAPKKTDGGDKTKDEDPQCEPVQTKKFIDKHWGSDINVLKMRDRLRGRRGKYWDSLEEPTNSTSAKRKRPPRPPVILLPGLASTRLTAWKHKICSNPLISDIKMLDNVWLNSESFRFLHS